MKTKLFLIIAISFTALFFSCKKDGKHSADQYDVYVAGHEVTGTAGEVAKYWKNGEGNPLTGGTAYGQTRDIAVSGSDIYVAGWIVRSGEARPTYWKNGAEVSLATASDGQVYGIAVSGNDVFCVGAQNSPTRAKYWKNGVPSFLSIGYSVALKVAISGSDVYISGFVSVAGKLKPVYWKNGVEISLDLPSVEGVAFDIAVNGSDVYATGYIREGTTPTAVFWKNGTRVLLDKSPSATSAESLAIKVESGLVYCAGIETKDGITRARYWKDGRGTNIMESLNKPMEASDIAVQGNDIFISGHVREADGKYFARCWKNGKEIPLKEVGVTSSTAMAVAVVKK